MKREEAIEQIKWYFEEDDGISAEDITKEAVDMAIEALQADAVQGWIPCSERLPQINETVITCDDDGGIHLDYIIKLGDSTLEFCQNVAYGDCDIIAWMPLPKPYKGGDTE